MPVDVEARVISNQRLSADYNVLALDAPAIAASVDPGQFVMLKARPGLEPLLRRPFSVFEILRDAAGRPTGLSVLSKRIGTSTAQIYDAQVGDTVACLGPLGRPFTVATPDREVLMVAGGVGLAPFISLAEALAARGVRPTLIYGARTAAELFYLNAFDRLGVRLELATEDGSRGTRGRVTVPLAAALAQTTDPDRVLIQACGPEPMLAAVAHLSARHRARCEVSVERVMGCGMGGCYSCVVPVRTPRGPHHVRSCISGPVFDAATLVWE
jgi:dihydroorotate dehydrogenase electron transfer subunit